ncbi:MAG TPA: PqqD family protein [Actinomycetales bacterium]|nr:PqqD family protein [Actinomycetales bacterium]
MNEVPSSQVNEGLSSQGRVVAASGTVWETVGEELVVWHGEDRTLHRLDPVGRWLWDLLEGGLTITQAEQLAAGTAGPEDGARARREVRDFVDSLRQRGLVRLVPLPDGGPALVGDDA